MNLLPLAVLSLLGALLFGGLPFLVSHVLLQGLFFAVSSAFLAVFLGLVAVNLLLNSSDRKKAALPLLGVISELAEQRHNDYFVGLGRDTFGSHRFGQLIDIYREHKGSPEAFSPADQTALYDMILSKKEDITKLFRLIEHDARDMAFILGWGYDAKILGAILATKANLLAFIKLVEMPSHDTESKKRIIECFFDIEFTMTMWVHRLAKKLGAKIETSETRPNSN